MAVLCFIAGLPFLLRWPILPTWDAHRASASSWQYGRENPYQPFTTSPLGILNGMLLRWFGRVVVSYFDAYTGVPAWPFYRVRRAWW